MDFYNTRMGTKFFNADVPKIANGISDLRDSINRLCDVMDPNNFQDDLIPATELDNALRKGASFVSEVMNGEFVIVRWQK